MAGSALLLVALVAFVCGAVAQVAPQAVPLRGGALAGGTGLALEGGHLAARVLAGPRDSVGVVDLYMQRNVTGGGRGQDPELRWAWTQRLLPPAESVLSAVTGFGGTIALQGEALAVTYQASNSDGRPDRGVAVYGLSDDTEQWTLEALFEEGGLQYGGPNLLAVSDEEGLLVVGISETAGEDANDAQNRRLLQDSALTTSYVGVYERLGEEWAIQHTIDLDGMELSAVTIDAAGTWIVVAGVSNDMGQEVTVRVFRTHAIYSDTGGQLWPQTAELAVSTNFSITSQVTLGMVANIMAVGAGSHVSVFREGTLLNWDLQDDFEVQNVTAAGHTMGLSIGILAVGTATHLLVYERQMEAPDWPLAMEVQLPGGSPSAALPAQVVQTAEIELTVMVPPSPAAASGSITYVDLLPQFPNATSHSNGTASEEDGPVTMMLKMIGITLSDLTDQRQVYLQEGIANVSMANEAYSINVNLDFTELYGAVYGRVEITVPPGYDRTTVGWDLFDGVRFGALNRILIAKDPFFERVQLSASSVAAFNPFAIPLEPTPTPEPTFPPSPLLMNIDENSTTESNQFITTTKEAFDANPPERTNNSIITYSVIAGGSALALGIGLLICRRAVMSKMLKQEVNRDSEWRYNPYESAAPRIAAVAKARMAVAKMQEDATYRKYYDLQEERTTTISTVGKTALFVNAFLSAKPPEEHQPEKKAAKAMGDVMKMTKGVSAFKAALGGGTSPTQPEVSLRDRYARAAQDSDGDDDDDFGLADRHSRPEGSSSRGFSLSDGAAGAVVVSDSLDIELDL